jgi:hypothetical protein
MAHGKIEADYIEDLIAGKLWPIKLTIHVYLILYNISILLGHISNGGM